MAWGDELKTPDTVVGKKKPLIKVVGQYLKVIRVSDGLSLAKCPFHADRDPSLRLYTETRTDEHFHCFGCHAHGDVIEFVRLIEGCSWQDAVGMATVPGTGSFEPFDEEPRIGREGEVETALLLVSRIAKQNWLRIPVDRWPTINERLEKICQKIRTSDRPMDVAMLAVRNRLG